MWIPPDTMGAAGPHHLMVTVNGQVRIQTRTGVDLGTVSLDTFWSALGPFAGFTFDPRVFYDAGAGRWITFCAADAWLGSSAVLLAVSDTPDPTGTWNFYALDADPNDFSWADYPVGGFNGKWIVLTSNQFTTDPNSPMFTGAKMWVVDKSTALAGGPITVSVFPEGFDLSGGVYGFTLQPCVTLDPNEPRLYLVDNSFWYDPNDGRMLLRISQISGSGSAPWWSVVPGSIFPDTGLFRVDHNFSWPQIDGPQLGDSRRIATDDARLMNAVFRNGHIWTVHSGGLPGTGIPPLDPNRTAAFWYELDPNGLPNPIVQSGVLDGGFDVHHVFPTIAVNCANDVCIGFSRFDPNRFAEAVYAVRKATAAAGSMGPIQLLKAGESTYYKTFGGSRNRWGDYSATMVDPNDDVSFWTIQEYAGLRVGPNDNDSRWGTWWGRIRFNSLIPGDVDGDGDVDLDDLTIVLQDFGCAGSCVGDADGDADVDLDDLTIVLQNFGA